MLHYTIHTEQYEWYFLMELSSRQQISVIPTNVKKVILVFF